MSVKSVISNIAANASKYGKSIKANVNRMSYPKLKFLAPLLTSRLFLYFLVFVTIVVLFTYVNTRDVTSTVALILIGFLASFFTKNMIIVLSVALLFTWVFKYAMKLRYEGFEGNDEEEEEKKDKKEGMENEKEEKEEDKKESMSTKDSTKDEAKGSNKSEDKEKEKEKDLKQLKKDYESFEEIQKNILGGVKKINTELDKAETFINKYEKYKSKHVTSDKN